MNEEDDGILNDMVADPENFEAEAPKEDDTDDAEDHGTPEERARKRGWRPKEDYLGDKEWVDAETFLKETDGDVHLLRKSLKTLERNYSKLEKTTDAIHAHTQRQIEAAKKEGYEKAIKEANDRLAEAVESGDIDEVNKAVEVRDKVLLKPQEKEGYTQADNDYADAWKTKNAWFGNDPALTRDAIEMCNIQAAKNASVQDQLEAAEKYVRETYPHKFRQTKEAHVMPGHSSGVRGHKVLKIGTYEALKPQYKSEHDIFVKEMVKRGKKESVAKAGFLNSTTPDMYVEGAKE